MKKLVISPFFILSFLTLIGQNRELDPEFEERVRLQIEQNIEDLGKCLRDISSKKSSRELVDLAKQVAKDLFENPQSDFIEVSSLNRPSRHIVVNEYLDRLEALKNRYEFIDVNWDSIVIDELTATDEKTIEGSAEVTQTFIASGYSDVTNKTIEFLVRITSGSMSQGESFDFRVKFTGIRVLKTNPVTE